MLLATASPAPVCPSPQNTCSVADAPSPDKNTALSQFEKLITTLSNVGLATEVRNGEDSSVLVFCKVASEEHLYGEIYRSRYVGYRCLGHQPHADATAPESATGSTAFDPPSLRERPDKHSTLNPSLRPSVSASYASS